MNRKRRLRIWRRLRAEMKKPFAERKANKRGMKPCSGREMMEAGGVYCPYIPLITSDAEKYRRASLAAANLEVNKRVRRFIDKALV